MPASHPLHLTHWNTAMVVLPTFLRLTLALCAGALYPFAFSPYEFWPLIFVSIALLWVALQRSQRGQAFWVGAAYGLTMFGIGVSWLHISMHTYGDTPLWLAIVLTGSLVLLMALFLAGFSTIMARLAAPRMSPIVFASLWLLLDVLRGWLFTGFPWLYAGYSVIDTPLAQLATVGGIWLVTWLVVFLGALLGALICWPQRSWRVWSTHATLALILVLAATFTPPSRYVEPAGGPIKVALLQGNIPQDLRWLTTMRHETRAIYAELSDQVPAEHIEIWPESALTEFYHDAEVFLEERARITAEKNGALIIGIPTYSRASIFMPGYIYNTLKVLTGGDGEYHKQKLVPFGEYVPFENQLRGLIPFFDLDMSSFSPGTEHQGSLLAKQVAIAPSICYEVVYPELVARQTALSNVMVTVSNDAWFGTSAGPHQHFQMARFRTIENGRWMLRSTNTGISAIINERGQVVDQYPQFERGVLLSSFAPLSGRTPYNQWGGWPIWLCAFLLCLPASYRYLSQYQPKATHS